MKNPFATVGVVCLVLAGCAAESEAVDGEEEAAASESPLSSNRQPKLELRLADPATHTDVAAPKVVCPTNNLVAVATLRGESFSKTVAEIIIEDATTGWSRTIATYPIGKEGVLGSLPQVPPPVPVLAGLGDLGAHAGHALTIKIEQRRSNGKLVGETAALPLRFSEPRADLLSVTRSSACPMTGPNGCYVASVWIHPSDASIAPADYACNDLRLQLGYRNAADTSWAGAYSNPLRPALFRGDAATAAMSDVFPWPEAPASAVLVMSNTAVSNTISLQ